MRLPAGTQIGTCEIIESIESGESAVQVYRGRDSKLGCEVAVRVLPDAFARDPLLFSRIERESQILAALNHPNLPRTHGVRKHAESAVLIHELVEGETLAQRMSQGPVPIGEALEIARQIAQGMEAAHQQGLFHGGLEPSSIRLTSGGGIKILDFGCTVDSKASAGVQDLSDSSEQVRRKSAAMSGDIRAFGYVLFEMLSGRQALPIGQQSGPDWRMLPASTPPAMRELLERCLSKEAGRRLHDIGDALVAIEDVGSFPHVAASGTKSLHPSRRWEIIFGMLGVMFFISAAVLAGRLFLSTAPAVSSDASLSGRLSQALFAEPASPPAIRFDVLGPVAIVGNFQLSPDGSKAAFVTNAVLAAGVQPRVWVRPIDSDTAQSIPSTAGTAPQIFWSPDSKNIGFFADGKLKKVPSTGGPAEVICDLPKSATYYGSWNANSVILFGSDSRMGGPLLRVSAGGGKPEPATELDAARKEVSHRYPNFLPDGRHFFYLAGSVDEGADKLAAYIGELDSPKREALPAITSEVKYVSNHVLFIRDGALISQRFDAPRLKLVGEAFPIADPFVETTAVTGAFSVSSTGTVAFRGTGPNSNVSRESELVWFDRTGSKRGIAASRAEYTDPQLSPDGKLVAFTRGAPRDIWILELETGATSRLTSNSEDNYNPRWSPDGKTTAYSSYREGVVNLYQHAVDVVGEDKAFARSQESQVLSDWSPDGKFLIYTAGGDVWALPVIGESKAVQVTHTPFAESMPTMSPDGRWIAFVSDEKGFGQPEVFVQSFTGPGVKKIVSSNGGTRPRWSHDGKELTFLRTSQSASAADAGFLMAVAVRSTGTTLDFGTPVALFSIVNRTTVGNNSYAFISSSYNVAPDKRFLVQLLSPLTTTGAPVRPTASTNGITVILNWKGRERP